MAIKVIVRAFILMVFHVSVLTGWSSVLAGETSPMLTDPAINEAYKDCGFFVFDNKNDGVLSSNVDHFRNVPETYWSQGVRDICIAVFRSQTLFPKSLTDAHLDGEHVNITIARRRYLAASHFCDGKPDYDECLEKAVFRFHGFYEANQGRWKRRVYNPGVAGGNLEKSMSETINGTIKNKDGITVISEWRRPYYFPNQTTGDLIVLCVIRRTPFGYIIAGGDAGIAIPVNSDRGSQIKAMDFVNRVIAVVQSVRMKSGD
ncbi:hypothetical protein [Burkholderia ubonensis]|uniref:hypothetical protein n=1 Tax=Burkholderia ubonensis TaxID=101571 RepID=UPI000AFE69DE|nr:hypothetical protein [Burkholderia ubonensis]